MLDLIYFAIDNLTIFMIIIDPLADNVYNSYGILKGLKNKHN